MKRVVSAFCLLISAGGVGWCTSTYFHVNAHQDGCSILRICKERERASELFYMLCLFHRMSDYPIFKDKVLIIRKNAWWFE